MKIGIIASNVVSITENAKRGTEIFTYSFISSLEKRASEANLDITAFASGDSNISIPIESVAQEASSLNADIPQEKHIIFELALLSKAFKMQDSFDLFHVNVGDGDIALPFSPFVNKPILITLHNSAHKSYVNHYFSLFKNYKNVFFVSISNAQRKLFPDINYVANIYHGVDANLFGFNKDGGNNIMWAGRGIPKKGMDTVVKIARSLNKNTHLFALTKDKHHSWLEHQINIISEANLDHQIFIYQNIERNGLVKYYQDAKLFLFPIEWEEPFGLVVIEALSCGTPIVSYARGSAPELIKDGVTGFLVNPSENDKRGDYVTKESGIEGLKKAVERIYSMSTSEYSAMRTACRESVLQNFTLDQMTDNYISVYKKLTTASQS